MATNVYVDAFNLYYGSLKGTPYRWLDLGTLCTRLLPKDRINRIRYFTATVSARPDNPDAPQRQQVYLRALETIPDLSIHYGHYLTHVTRMPLANPPQRGARTVKVVKTEEKGSDVNLATYLLLDAFQRDCKVAVVISKTIKVRAVAIRGHKTIDVRIFRNDDGGPTVQGVRIQAHRIGELMQALADVAADVMVEEMLEELDEWRAATE